jgi:hypothetical protein
VVGIGAAVKDLIAVIDTSQFLCQGEALLREANTFLFVAGVCEGGRRDEIEPQVPLGGWQAGQVEVKRGDLLGGRGTADEGRTQCAESEPVVWVGLDQFRQQFCGHREFVVVVELDRFPGVVEDVRVTLGPLVEQGTGHHRTDGHSVFLFSVRLVEGLMGG